MESPNCRLCIRYKATTKGLNEALHPPVDAIFEGIEELEKLLRKILKVDDNGHNLPVSICLYCDNELRRIYTFLDQCKRSEQILREMSDCTEILGAETAEEKVTPTTAEFLNPFLAAVSEIKTENVFKETLLPEIKQGTDDDIHMKDRDDIVKDNETHVVKEELIIEEIPVKSECESEDNTANCEILTIDSDSDFEVLDANDSDINRLNKGEYSCHLCTANYNNPYLLQEHVRLIHKGFGFECNQCNAKFTRADNLRVHRKFHTRNLFECDHCGKKYNTPGGLKRHAVIHEGETFDCTECNKKFPHKALLLRHFETHTIEMYKSKNHRGKFAPVKSNRNDKHLICDECGKQFTRLLNLTNHKRLHSGETFDCLQCDSKFVSQDELNKHGIVHLDDTRRSSTSCNQCGEQFLSAKSLRLHREVFHLIRTFDCKQCLEKYENASDLRMHIQTIHFGGDEKIYGCDECNKKFSTEKNLKCHQKSHRRQFTCDPCNMLFSTSKHLEEHKDTIHGGGETETYNCDQCDAKFNWAGSLKYHRRIHTGKTFDCDQCNAKFVRLWLLKRHKAVHSDEKPFECTICGMRFRDEHARNLHQVVHTDLRFECDRCNAKFSREYTLSVHRRIHADEDDVAIKVKRRVGSLKARQSALSESQEAAMEI